MKSAATGLQILWKRAQKGALVCDTSYYPVLELNCTDISALEPFLSKFLVWFLSFDMLFHSMFLYSLIMLTITLQDPQSYLMRLVLANKACLSESGVRSLDSMENNFILREIEVLLYDPSTPSRPLLGPATVTFIPSHSDTSSSVRILKVCFEIIYLRSV